MYVCMYACVPFCAYVCNVCMYGCWCVSPLISYVSNVCVYVCMCVCMGVGVQGELILAPLFVKMSGWQIHCQKSFKNTLWQTFPSFRVGEYFVRGSVASARPLHTNILTYKPFLHNVLEHPSSFHLHFCHAKGSWSLKKELRISCGCAIWSAFSHAKCILMMLSTMSE